MKKFIRDDQNWFAKLCKMIILCIPMMYAGVTMDNDFWFVINHGRYILANGFANIEPFTVHEGLAFSFEKWLTCIVFYKVYDWFGAWGMYIFMLLLFGIVLALFYKACLIFSKHNENVSIILTAVIMSVFAWAYVRTRPQIFSYMFLLGELICLERYARTGKVKKLCPLPFLAFLYMQFHSTMLPIFFIMAMPYLFDYGWVDFLGITGGRYWKRPIYIVLVISAALTLINPYGVRSFYYLISSLNDGGLLSTINEVKHSSFNDIKSYSGPVLVCQGLYILLRIFRRIKYKKKEKFLLRYLFMLGGTFVMALYAVRNNAFFLLMGGPICAWELRHINLDFKFMPALKKLGAFVVIGCMIYNWSFSYDIMRSTYAWRVLDQFAEIHPDTDIRMYTDFNCGSYAEWKGFRCYADPRAEVFLKSVNGKEDILAEIWDSMHAKLNASELQEKYGFDYWLVQKDYWMDSHLKYDKDYELICEEDDYKVYKYLPNGK